MRRVAVISCVILGLWALLSWWGERGQRIRLEEIQSRTSAREALLEQQNQDLQADRLRLERDLFRAERAKQRATESLGQAVQRLRERAVDKSRSKNEDMKPKQRERELQELRDNLQLVGRINRSLRRNGGGWIRILSLEEVEDKTLYEVMLSVVDRDGLFEGAYLASSCRIHMDRKSGTVRLVLGKGLRFLRKKKLPFDDGLELVFDGHWPRLFAKDLHELITFEGAWEKPKKKPKPSGDLAVVRRWRQRLESFFEALSVKGPRLKLHGLEGVGLGCFEGVTLFGYTKKGILEQSMKAQKMEFWIDKGRDRVELRLVDGFVEDEGGRIDFPKKTWRMVLTGMGAKEAGRLLAGFVQYLE